MLLPASLPAPPHQRRNGTPSDWGLCTRNEALARMPRPRRRNRRRGRSRAPSRPSPEPPRPTVPPTPPTSPPPGARSRSPIHRAAASGRVRPVSPLPLPKALPRGPPPGRAYVPREQDLDPPRPTGWTHGRGQILVAVTEDELRILHALREGRGAGPVRIFSGPGSLRSAGDEGDTGAEYSPT